jgi:hypothetical protein
MVKIERRKGSLTARELAQITSSRPVVRKVRPVQRQERATPGGVESPIRGQSGRPNKSHSPGRIEPGEGEVGS